LIINELAIYYQHPNFKHDHIVEFTDNAQTLADYKVESQGKITVVINGEHGISDL
jgi:hypothetical protein